jgi:hypothetical protein
MALVAVWREGLLAQKVLRGLTKGYKHHPQLRRFREMPDPVEAIGTYLASVVDEADARGYAFDRTKIAVSGGASKIPVTDGQLLFEIKHLRRKLRVRDRTKLKEIAAKLPQPHPLFRRRKGGVESWEVL